jgi:hypothetical protein
MANCDQGPEPRRNFTIELEHTPLPPAAQEELRRKARLRSTHYSTRIEGNRLTLAEAERRWSIRGFASRGGSGTSSKSATIGTLCCGWRTGPAVGRS